MRLHPPLWACSPRLAPRLSLFLPPAKSASCRPCLLFPQQALASLFTWLPLHLPQASVATSRPVVELPSYYSRFPTYKLSSCKLSEMHSMYIRQK